MKFKVLIVLIFLICKNSFAEPNNLEKEDFFYIGKMQSYNNDFILYFKTRSKAVLARGEEFNYIILNNHDLCSINYKNNNIYISTSESYKIYKNMFPFLY